MNEFSARDRPFQRRRRQKSIRAKKSRSRRRSIGADGDVYRNEETLKEENGDDGQVDFSPNFSVSFAVSKRLKKVIKVAPATHASRKIPLLRRMHEVRRSKVLVSKTSKSGENFPRVSEEIFPFWSATSSRPSDCDVTFMRDSLVGDRVTTRSPKHHLYSGGADGRHDSASLPLSPISILLSLFPLMWSKLDSRMKTRLRRRVRTRGEERSSAD